MRARSREINIFNMSLLDILCGALGAFCFMMLVLLPYYKPPATEEDLRKERADTDELVKEMEKLKEAAKDSAFAQQMEETMQKLQDQIKQLQGQVNQSASQNQQLQTENDSLKKKNQEQQQSLNQRNPFLIYASTDDLSQDLDLYVQDDLTVGGKRNPPFDPAKPHHNRFWTGDINGYVSGRGIALWVVRDSPANVHYKVYLKLANDTPVRKPTGITASILSSDKETRSFSRLTLSPERFWTLAGTLSADAQGTGTVTLQDATQQERDAEWSKLSKGATPPPPAPSIPAQTIPFGPASPAAANSPPRPGATAMSEEERKARLERMEQLRKRQQQSPAARPTASP